MKIASVLLAVPFFLASPTVIVRPPLVAATPITNDDNCIDLADFFYDIFLALSTFPEATCGPAEEVEISQFLEQQFNLAMKSVPGTIRTKNKLCSRPINTGRRRNLKLQDEDAIIERSLLLNDNEDGDMLSFLFASHVEKLQQEELLFFDDEQHAISNASSLLENDPGNHGMDDASFPLVPLKKNQDHRQLLRNFIYVGGGRCRFCFFDNADLRRDLHHNADTAIASSRLVPPEEEEERELLYYAYDDDQHAIFKKRRNVTDLVQCVGNKKEGMFEILYKSNFLGGKRGVWTNEKITKTKFRAFGSVLGPYAAGDSFQQVFDAKQYSKKNQQIEKKKEPKHKGPVLNVLLTFHFWSIDIPSKYAGKFLGDDPLYILINGVKIDLSLLRDSSKNRAGKTTTFLHGTTFAGMRYVLGDSARVGYNYGYGKEKDRRYWVILTIPLHMFDASRKIDMKFVVKPEAKARKYLFPKLEVKAWVTGCEILGGLESRPFEEFKAVTEQKMQEQLGLDLAREFQTKTGHCLENKIPIVNVNLVQKTKWKYANPRC